MSKIVRSIVGLASVFSLLFVFQNCGAPLDSTSDLSSKADSLPFAFDTEIDHIAYMSCSNMTSSYDANAFWTFKVGAYNSNSGLKLTDQFLHSARKLSTNDKIKALAVSPANAGSTLQLSVRSTSDFQSVFATNNNASSAGRDYSNFSTSFDNTAIGSQLVHYPTQRHNTFTELGLNNSIRLKTNFVSNENVAASLRNLLSSNGLLTLTYNNSDSSPLLAQSFTYGSKTSVYGRGYKISFRYGHGINNSEVIVPYNGGTMRALAGIEQKNLETNALEGGLWDCSQKYTFMIVRPEDIGVRVRCGANLTSPEPSPTDPELRDIKDTLRKIVPASEWSVDLNKRCIVPKKTGSCYGNNANAINYNGGTCDPSKNECPHYLSICVKR